MRADRAENFQALTSWRGICALGVALFHFPVFALTRSVPLIAHAYLFVDFFFVLSGFVIASAYEGRLTDAASRASFAIRRFGRLWPLHVAILAALVAVALARGEVGVDENHSAFSILTNLVLIQSLGMHHDYTWNNPSWSISIEAALYAMFLLLSFLPRRGAVYLALAIASLAVLHLWAPRGMASTFDFGIFRGIAGFFTGALIQRMPRRDLGLPGELAVVALVGVFVSLGHATLLAPLVFGLTVYVFAHARGGLSRLLEAKSALWLGERSFSIYMVHWPLVTLLVAFGGWAGLHQVGHHLAGGAGPALAVLAAFVAATLALSALTYAMIEKPARRYFNARAAGTPSHRRVLAIGGAE